MRWARSTIYFSVFCIVASIALLATKGLNLGVDFTGGTVMEVGYPAAANIPAVASIWPRTATATPRCRISALPPRCWCACR
jgi:preprotein translocase subunit SecF